MKKALLVTTVSGFVPQFEMNNVKILQEMGYEVHYAANYDTPSYGTDNHRLDGTGIIRHQVDFVRSPYSMKNLRVYRQLSRLMQAGVVSVGALPYTYGKCDGKIDGTCDQDTSSNLYSSWFSFF